MTYDQDHDLHADIESEDDDSEGSKSHKMLKIPEADRLRVEGMSLKYCVATVTRIRSVTNVEGLRRDGHGWRSTRRAKVNIAVSYPWGSALLVIQKASKSSLDSGDEEFDNSKNALVIFDIGIELTAVYPTQSSASAQPRSNS